jgi:hypothetical protein
MIGNRYSVISYQLSDIGYQLMVLANLNNREINEIGFII